MHSLLKYRHSIWVFFALLCLLVGSKWRFQWFDDPYSHIVLSANQELLGASIASDGQWRFPSDGSTEHKYLACLIAFEDNAFLGHNGVYIPSIVRALHQNLTENRIVSGGSTITMQLARMARKNPPRTWWEKCIEMIIAWQIEQSYSKEEIVSMYAAHAPFGGNVVGLEAAAWRYYGRPSTQLSWAECATLAALPNAPSLIYPGKSQTKLIAKRNFILQKLTAQGVLSPQELEQSLTEVIPQKPSPLPQFAPHLLDYLIQKYPDQKRFQTTIDPDLQKNASRILSQHMVTHQANMIHNCAAMIVDVKTGQVLMYHGNTPGLRQQHQGMVDIIHAPRSTGSILKPILYAAMLQEGAILPETLIDDIPIQFNGFAPKNYFETYDGLVPASNALSRSLNIPAVVMLQQYGYPRFMHLLQRLGLHHINRPADDYGLSIILGGAESSLWDITRLYAGMGRVLHTNAQSPGSEPIDNYARQSVLPTAYSDELTVYRPLNAAAVWCTYQALMKVNRPDSELGWQGYDSAVPIAWKTGTSFGNRDAWAVGSTAEYVISVWIGNADGTGRPGLTGVQTAAPILFDLFKLLDHKEVLAMPQNELKLTEICAQSGMRKGENCIDSHWQWIPFAGLHTNACDYHKLLFIDPNTRLQVNSNCFPPHQMIAQTHFEVPPVQAYYYKSKHPDYLTAPPMHPLCAGESSLLGIIYPRRASTIYLSKGLNGQIVPIVFQATHQSPDQKLFWHLDNQYMGETHTIHQMEFMPTEGWHTIAILDEKGHRDEVQFEAKRMD